MHPSEKPKPKPATFVKKKIGKILMLGAKQSGKSCLLNRYETGEYDEESNQPGYEETVFKLIPVDEDENIKIEIYDPGYKELRDGITQEQLFENVTSIMFVYDMTNKASYDCAKDL